MFWTVWGPGKQIPFAEGGYAVGPLPAAATGQTAVAAVRGTWYAAGRERADRTFESPEARRAAAPPSTGVTPLGRTFIGLLVAAVARWAGPAAPAVQSILASSIRLPVSTEDLGIEGGPLEASRRAPSESELEGQVLQYSEGIRITRGTGDYPAQTVTVQTAQGPQTVEVPGIAMPQETQRARESAGSAGATGGGGGGGFPSGPGSVDILTP